MALSPAQEAAITKSRKRMAAKGLSPEHLAYAIAAERVRRGDDSPEAMAACRAAEAAYRATLPPPTPTKPGWYNLPMAQAMWEGDARDLGAI